MLIREKQKNLLEVNSILKICRKLKERRLISENLVRNLKSRSSHTDMFSRKGGLKICSKFTGEHPYLSAILIMFLCNSIEITLQYRCSPVNLAHIFRTPFPKNTSGRLLMKWFNNYSSVLKYSASCSLIVSFFEPLSTRITLFRNPA